jgi:uncharacterized protein YbaP (TraB family)
LTSYKSRLPDGVTFEFDDSKGLVVEADAVKDQVDAKTLAIPA